MKTYFKKLLAGLSCMLFTISMIANYAYAEPPAVQAAKNILNRQLPKSAHRFIFIQIPKDSVIDKFEITSTPETVTIKGNTVTAMAYGVTFFLNNYCNASFSWNGDQNVLPKHFPIIQKPVIKTSPFKYRYAFNYCTFNYTMAFWNWERWERELDLMALNGVNIALAPIGNEAVWQNTLKQFGYTFPEIQQFIVGPAYIAWWLMGNLEGEGGPVSQAYIDSRVNLQQKILARMRSLQIEPVLQGYVGMVPTNFKTKHPDAEVIEQGNWCGYYKRPYWIKGKYVNKLAKVWYEEADKLYGKSNFYGGDAFHEGGIVPKDLNVQAYATNIQNQMLQNNPNAIWLLQAWQTNPRTDLLNGLKKENTLVLDYSNDVYGFWKDRKGFDNTPWIFGVINNFGGRMGMYGRLEKVANATHEMLTSNYKKNNVGIGVAPEAIIYNQVSYDIMWDLAWDTTLLSVDNWINSYANRRYGKQVTAAQQAWQLLKDYPYNCNADQEGGSESIFNARPKEKVTNVSCCSTTEIYYPTQKLVSAWALLHQAIPELKNKTTFKFDLVDVTRQILANYGLQVYHEMMQAYKDSNQADFQITSSQFLQLMHDQEELLNTREEFLLGSWIADARILGTTPAEKNIFELNARALPTTWNTTADGMLHDYAHHEWAGLTGDLYIKRWTSFINYLSKKLGGEPVNKPNFFKEIEYPWTHSLQNNFRTMPTKNEIAVCKKLYKKYYSILANNQSNP